MSFYTFDPMTEDEINSLDLLENGIYDFEVIKSERKTSKSGNPMAEINLKIWDKEGRVHFIYDYLVFTKQKLPMRKISHFCKAVGLEKEYSEGKVPESLNGLSGKVELGMQEAKPKPEGGMYPAKNSVIDYVKADAQSIKSPTVYHDLNDPLPF